MIQMPYQERIEWINARIDEYVAGEITEPVFRASLFGKGRLRGEELVLTIRDAETLKHERSKQRVQPTWHPDRRNTRAVEG